MLKEKTKLRIKYLENLSFKSEEEIKIFPDKQKLKDFVDSFIQPDWLQSSRPSSDLDHCSKNIEICHSFPLPHSPSPTPESVPSSQMRGISHLMILVEADSFLH